MSTHETHRALYALADCQTRHVPLLRQAARPGSDEWRALDELLTALRRVDQALSDRTPPPEQRG